MTDDDFQLIRVTIGREVAGIIGMPFARPTGSLFPSEDLRLLTDEELLARVGPEN